jgi:hypothetical protein
MTKIADDKAVADLADTETVNDKAVAVLIIVLLPGKSGAADDKIVAVCQRCFCSQPARQATTDLLPAWQRSKAPTTNLVTS